MTILNNLTSLVTIANLMPTHQSIKKTSCLANQSTRGFFLCMGLGIKRTFFLNFSA